MAHSVVVTERDQLIAPVDTECLASDRHLERGHFGSTVNDIAALLVVVVRWRIECGVVRSGHVGRDIVESGTRVKDSDVTRGG